MPISFLDPSLYTKAAKGAKSLLQTLRDADKPAPTSGALERIRSEYTPPPSTGALKRILGQDEPGFIGPKLPSTKEKYGPRLDLLKQKDPSALRSPTFMEKLKTKGKFLFSDLTGRDRQGAALVESREKLKEEEVRTEFDPAFKKQVSILDEKIAEIEKDYDSASMSFSNNRKRLQLNKLKKSREKFNDIIERKPQFAMDTIKKDIRKAGGTFTILPEVVRLYDLYQLSKKDKKDFTTEDEILFSEYLIDQHEIRSTGSELTSGLVGTAEFGAEMATSGWLLKGIKKRVSRNVLDSIETQMGKEVRNTIERSFQSKAERIIREIPSTMLQTILQQGTVVEVVRRNVEPELELVDDKKGGAFELIENDKGFLEATSRALGSRFVENYTERLGDYMNIPKSKAITNLKRTLMRRWIKNEGVENAMKRLEGVIRWDGIIPEILEEEIGEPFQALIDEREYNNPITTPEGRDRLFQETLMILTFDSLMKSPQYVGTIKKAVEDIAKDTRGEAVMPIPLGKEPTPEMPKKRTDFIEDMKADLQKSKEEQKSFVISSDILQEKLQGYKPGLADEYHGEGSRLSDVWLTETLKDPDIETVTFMSGGPGSGKTEFGVKLIKHQPNNLIFDGTLASRDKAFRRVKQAVDSGKKVKIHPVVTDPVRAYIFKSSRERVVNDEAFIKKHGSYGQVLRELSGLYPDIEFTITSNAEGGHVTKTFTDRKELLDFLDKNTYNESEVRDRVNEYNRRKSQGILETGVRATREGRDIVKERQEALRGIKEVEKPLPKTEEAQRMDFEALKSAVPPNVAKSIKRAAKLNVYNEERMLREYIKTKKLPAAVILPSQPTKPTTLKKPTTKEILEAQEKRGIQAEALRSEVAGFEDADIKIFDKVRRLMQTKKYAEGDIETLRKDEPKIVAQVTERYNEATKQDLVDTEAFEAIMELPSMEDLKVAERGLTLKERHTMRQAELTSLRARIKTAEKSKEKAKAIQDIKAAIIDYAKRNLDLHERGKLLATVKNARTMKDFGEAMKRIDVLEEASQARELRKEIPKELRKYEAKRKEKGKTSVKYEMIRTGYKEIFKNDTSENLRLEFELSKKIETNIDLSPQDLVTYALLTESTKDLSDMNSKELETVLERIKEEQLPGRESFLSKQVNRAWKIDNDIDDSVDNLQSRKDVTAQNENLKKKGLTDLISVMDVFDRGYAQLVTMLDSVRGGKFFKQVLYRPIQKANEKFFAHEAKYTAQDKKMFEDVFLEGREVTKLNKINQGFILDREIKKFRKQEYIKELNVWLSQGEMVDIHISSMMEDNSAALTENGMYLGGKNPKKRVLRFTPEIFATVKSKMSPEAKKITDYIIEQIRDPEFIGDMQKSYEEKYNKPFPFVEGGYWTMIRRYMGVQQEGVDLLSPDQKYKATLSPSSFKERVNNAYPLLITDGFTKFFNWRNDISRFIAYDKTFSDISSVINSRDFKSEFIAYFGHASYRQLVDSFEFTVNNGQSYSDLFARGINAIKQVMSIWFIGGKTRNILSQGSSALAAIAEVPVGDFTVGITKAITNPAKAYDKLAESPVIRYRHAKAGFSKGMMEQETTAYAKQGVDIPKTAMVFTRWGDMAGVVGAGYAVYDSKLKQYKKAGYGDKTADQMALDDGVDFVIFTQQSALPEFSNWIKRSHPLIRTAGAFQQAQSMYRAKYYDSIRQWHNDPNKWSKKSMTKLAKDVIAYQFVLPGMYEITRGNWNPFSLIAKTVFSPISGFMGIGKVVEYGIMYALIKALLPLLGADDDDWEYLMPFDPSSLGGEALLLYEKTMKSMGDVFEGEADEKDFWNIIDGAAATLKIPLKNLREEYLKSKDIVTGDDRRFKRLLQTEWQAEQDQPKSLLDRSNEEVLTPEDRIAVLNELRAEVKAETITKEEGIKKMKDYDRWQGYMKAVEKEAEYIREKGFEGEKLERYYGALQDNSFMKNRDKRKFNKTQIEVLRVMMGEKPKEPKPLVGKEKYLEERGIIGRAVDFARAFSVDRQNAWKALTTKEKLGIVEGNLVELQRFYGLKHTEKGGSEEVKRRLMADMGLSWEQAPDYKLEHILPVTAGGGTEDSNLVPITNEEWESYTPLDIALGIAIKQKLITREEAIPLVTALKVNKTITGEEFMEAIENF